MIKSIDKKEFIKIITGLLNITKNDPESDINDDIAAYNAGKIEQLKKSIIELATRLETKRQVALIYKHQLDRLKKAIQPYFTENEINKMLEGKEVTGKEEFKLE